MSESNPPRGRKTPIKNPRKDTSLKNHIKKNEMELNKGKSAGSSEARERQGGYCPASPPPRSCASHESGVGLPAALKASEAGKRVIAERTSKEKEDIDLYEEERSSSEHELTEGELKRMKLNIDICLLTEFGMINLKEGKRLLEKVLEETKEFLTGDKRYFMIDLTLETALKLMDTKMTEKEKHMEIRVCANIAKNVVNHLENSLDVETRRSQLYKEGYHRMKEQCLSYRRKPWVEREIRRKKKVRRGKEICGRRSARVPIIKRWKSKFDLRKRKG